MKEPSRIVSLVPSDTYTLVRLGVGPRIIGRTEYCKHALEAPAVGGTKNADVEAILALAPDLVVANQEENRKKDIDGLLAAGVPVLMSFPKTVGEGLAHAERLAALFPSLDCAAMLAEARDRYQRLAARDVPVVPTFVPIWMDPLMTVHGDTFISDAVELAGGRNVFSDRARRYPLAADLGLREAVEPGERDTRYPRVTLEEVAARAPLLGGRGLILLPDEPHEFSEADAGVFRGLSGSWVVRFCDGKDLMWYGLRSLEGLDRIAAVVDEARGKV